MTELHYLAASEALARFRDRSLSPVELTRAILARIEAVDGTVNALPIRFEEAALEQARRAEARYGGKGPRPRPLEGLCVAVKEETPVAGQPWTQGSLIYKDEIAPVTATCIERIIRAGGIIHARSTAPEFSCAPFTHSRLWGHTRNPWNTACTPGGSSGGSAAALAAGMATLATGSDIGGSIRIPASFCGVVGFKPPYGRVPEFAPFNLDHYCHEGPLARSVEDVRLLENVMAGPSPDDVVSLRPKLTVPARPGPITGWRVALCRRLGDFVVDPDVEANLLQAADALRAAGAIVEEVELPWRAEEIRAAATTHFNAIFGSMLAEIAAEHGDLMTDYALWFANEAVGATAADFLPGLVKEAEIYQPLGELLVRHRALICPTFAIPAFPFDQAWTSPVTSGGHRYGDPWETMMTVPFNIASRCPVLAVPSGFAGNGVPTGMSIVGRTYDDVSVFRVASAYERERPWAATRPVL